MPPFPRYAIYYMPAPDSALCRFGAELLGYDAFTGEGCEHPDALRRFPDWPALTDEPRKYGFHATLKAPFPLAATAREDELIAAVDGFAFHDIPRIAPVMDLLSEFAAIVPAGPVPALSRLADECVTRFERFRAPLTEAERARRLKAGLTPRQIGHVDRFGYPYVFEDFRFHMTLTARLQSGRSSEIVEYLRQRFDKLRLDEIAVDAIALCRQSQPDKYFEAIAYRRLSES